MATSKEEESCRSEQKGQRRAWAWEKGISTRGKISLEGFPRFLGKPKAGKFGRKNKEEGRREKNGEGRRTKLPDFPKRRRENTVVVTGDSETEKKKKPKEKKKGRTGDGGSSRKKKQKYESSSWFREKSLWASYIRKHREDVRNSTFVIDDAAPILNVSSIYDPEVLKALWGELKDAFEGPQIMVKKIYAMNILSGKTDTFTFDFSKPLTSNYAARKRIAKTIEKENMFIARQLRDAKTRLMTVKEHAEEWKIHEAVVESSSQFPLWWKIKKGKAAATEIPPPMHYFKQHVTEKSAKYPDKRPRVFLEISIKNVGVVGKMVAMLYSDYVPMTVKNFLAFCDPKSPLTYKGNFFYFIFPNYYCQTGDVVENRGFGGTSIYGPYFGNEDSTLDHAERGVLTMYSKIPNRNGSQFLITFRKLESLDGQNVVFGKIVRGLHVLDTIESVGSKKTGRPKVEIYISDCEEI